MSRVVQELIYRLRADTAGLVSGLKTAGDKADKVSKKFTDTGKKMTAGLTLPIVGVGVAMVKLAGDAGKAADRLLDLEQITGLSTDTLQELDLVAVEAGVSSEGLARSVQRFSQRLPQLESGTGNSAKALERLGVSIRDGNGEIRSADDLLPDFIRSLEGVENVTDRNALAQQIFGRSLDDLGPVLGLGADRFEELRIEARAAGLIIGKDALEAANDYRVEIESMQLRIQRARQEIGQELIPVISDLIPIFEDAVGVVINAVKYFTDLETETQKTILAIGGVVAGLGPMLLIVGKTIAVVKAATVAFGAFWVAVTGPVGLAVAGIAAAGAAVIGLARSIRNVANEDRERRAENEEILYRQKAQTLELQEHQQLAERQRTSSTQLKEVTEQRAESERLAAEQVERQLQAQRQLTELREGTIQELTRIDELVAAGAISEEEGLSRKISLREAVIETILREAQAGTQTAEAAARAIQDQQLNIERYRRALEKTGDTVDEVGEREEERLTKEREAREEAIRINDRYIQRLQEQNLSQLELLELQKHKEIQLAEETGADIWLIEQYYANEIDELREKMAEDEKQRVQDGIDNQIRAAEESLQIAGQLIGQLTTLSNQLYQNRKATLDIEYDERVQRAQDTIEDEEELADKIEEINQERAVEMAKIARKEAAINKLLSAAQAGIATSLAVTKALPNIPLAIAIGVLGAAQIAAILAEPLPQVPKFADGGSFTVPPGFSQDSFPLPSAFVQSGERVTVETAEQQALNRGGGRPMRIMISLDGRTIAASTAEYINDGVVRLEAVR